MKNFPLSQPLPEGCTECHFPPSSVWPLNHIYLFRFGVLYCSSICLRSCSQDSSWVRSCQLSAFSWTFHIADICCGYQAGSASFLWDSLCEFSLLGTGLFLPSQSLGWTCPVSREATFWSGPGGFCWSWLSKCFFGDSILQYKLSLVWGPLRVFLFSAYRINDWDLFIWIIKSDWTLFVWAHKMALRTLLKHWCIVLSAVFLKVSTRMLILRKKAAVYETCCLSQGNCSYPWCERTHIIPGPAIHVHSKYSRPKKPKSKRITQPLQLCIQLKFTTAWKRPTWWRNWACSVQRRIRGT